MKQFAAVLLLAAGASLATVDATADYLNPMSRVANLLESLAKKKEIDAKAETELWEKYVCWYKTVVATKKQTNKMAKARIEALDGYIADIEGGKIEFTNEREDLEKQTADLQAGVDKANELREKEHEDYEAAKDEMEKAIASLDKAVQVLGDATKDMKEGVLLVMGNQLKQVMRVGKTFLGKTDSQLLQRALEGDDSLADGVPNVMGNLGKDPKFNKKYKARSSKIQEILADMLQTFKDNLDDANKKEQETKASFDTLMASKVSQLEASQDALAAGNEEDGARNLNKQEAVDERDMLKARTENDEKFVQQAEDAYAVKSTEWKERQRLRSAEMASISEALSVLRSDDARDLSKKSFSSQGNFLQQSESCSRKVRASKAIKILRKNAKKHSDLRLSLLATLLHKGKFEKVEKAIDKMVEDLHAEEDEDLETKEHCEEDRMTNTKLAKKTSQEIDDKTAFITRKNAAIATLKTKIANLIKNIQDIQANIASAKANRDAENNEYKTAKADDVAAVGLVEKTMDVLKKFYEDNGLVLAQGKTSHARVEVHSQVQQAPEMTAAGEAPPPPPPTWSDGGYAGSPGESNGIQAILEMISDDIKKDIKTATAEEDASQEEFDEYKDGADKVIASLEETKAEYEGEVGDKEGDIEVAKSERSDKKSILDDTMAYLKTIAPGCDYMAVNFELRKQNRAEEIEGLAEAKAALDGGSFNFLQREPADDDCDDGSA